MTEIAVDQIRSAVEAELPGVRADLERLVRIPSVSADPAAGPELRRCAEEVAGLLRGAGLPDVEILQVDGGQPAVLAHRDGPPGAPTVLLYAHHDVQPTGSRADWHTDPFEPTERDGRLYGRGAADDKAGIAVHLAALRAMGDRLPVGVTVLVEGEEEIGSPTLETFLRTHRDRLAADVIVLADGGNWTVDVPALTTTLRGLVNVVVEVRTLDHALHSGMYGGAVPDALTALCRLLATLHDDAGDTAVPGLRGGPADPLDLTEDRFRQEAGLLDGVALVGRGGLTERIWTRPSITVLAVDAPAVAAASNTLQPAARAKISLRVAPAQRAHEAYEALAAHLRAHAPWGAQVEVTLAAAGEPFTIDASGPAYDAARASFTDAWDGTRPVDTGVGGSIPFVAAFAEAFPQAAILVTGVEEPDTRAHGANESLHLGVLARACIAEALLLARLGADPAE